MRSSYRNIEYHVLHTGGFVRLCTMRGRMYWLAQNQTGHTTPDWKLHFSVELQDIPRAWDLLAALFLERGCEVGIKATYAHLRGERHWSATQRGREITLYIFEHDTAFEEAQEDECCLWLGTEYERREFFHHGSLKQCSHGLHGLHAPVVCPEHDTFDALLCCFAAAWPYYASLVRAAEARLEAAGIRSRGCADGDLALGAFTSLRNEAFVPHKVQHQRHEDAVAPPRPATSAAEAGLDARGKARRGEEHMELVYPPNECGWNAASHRCPLPIFEMRCAASGLGVQDPFAREGGPQWLE